MSVHSTPAGWLPVGEVNDRFSETVPPGLVEADDRAKISVPDWQKAAPPDRKPATATVAYFMQKDITK